MSRYDERRRKHKSGKFKKQPVNKLLLFGAVALILALIALMFYMLLSSDQVKMNKDPFGGVKLPRIANFITSECEKCSESVEVLNELQEEFKGQVLFKTFLSSKNTAYILKYGITQIPAQVVLDENGQILGISENSHITREDVLTILESFFGIDVAGKLSESNDSLSDIQE